eukprot:538518-Amphidinium_carterae.1
MSLFENRLNRISRRRCENLGDCGGHHLAVRSVEARCEIVCPAECSTAMFLQGAWSFFAARVLGHPGLAQFHGSLASLGHVIHDLAVTTK